MRTFWIVVIVLLIASLMNAVRNGTSFHLAEALPLFGGLRPNWLYDAAGGAMLLITVWGLVRLSRHGR